MANIYFEISDAAFGKLYPHQYYVINDVPDYFKLVDIVPLQMAYCANRIWQESEDTIRFLKHRYKPKEPLTPEELKEFFWIKLKSHQKKV